MPALKGLATKYGVTIVSIQLVSPASGEPFGWPGLDEMFGGFPFN